MKTCEYKATIKCSDNLKEVCNITNHIKSERVSSGICRKNLYLC
jgi:hypothetical protein